MEQHGDIGDPLLWRAYADAYLLTNMEVVLLPEELIVVQPDFTPLTPEEDAELTAPL